MIFSNVSLCCVLVLLQLAWTDTVRGSCKIRVKSNACMSVCVCVSVELQQKKRESVCHRHGSEIKYKKPLFPQLNIPMGGGKEGLRGKTERL